MSHEVELLWFSDCSNHPAARQLLRDVIAELVPGTQIHEVDATDPATAEHVRFPGSPTIRTMAATSTRASSTPATTHCAAGCTAPTPAFEGCRRGAGSRTPFATRIATRRTIVGV